jgi:peptide/nickel transport system substrate-binding protein
VRTQVIAAAFALAASLGAPSLLAQEPTILTIAAQGDNTSFDRALLEIGPGVLYWMPLFDTLLLLDRDGNPQPNLVTAWSYNDDNTVLHLELRDGLVFSDGTPLDATAVKANLEHLKSGTGQNSYMAAAIDEVKIVSPTELDLDLSAPEPGLVRYLGVVGGAMASPASLGTEQSATQPIGSGAYTLDADETVPGRQYVYERSATYWNPEAYPYDRIVIIPMTDISARVNALKAGQVNAALASPAYADEAKASGLQVNTTQTDWTGLFLADREGKQVPALADLRVRQAINFAFDRPAMVEHLLRGMGEVTNLPVGPRSQAYDPALEGTYTYDPDRARALLAEAGYAEGFEVSMPLVGADDAFAPFVEQQLADIGIKVNWVNVPQNAIFSQLLSNKFPMFQFSLGSQSAWQDLRKFAFTNSPWNTAKVADPAIDALLEKAQYATGTAQDEAIRAVIRHVVEQAYFVTWFRNDTVYLTDAKTNVVMQSQNIAPWIRNFSPAE